MGQEISQQSKLCDINNNNNNNNNNNINKLNRRRQPNLANQNCCNDIYTQHKHPDPIYVPTSNCSTSSTSSTTDDECYRQKQKYNFHKQAFEKTKVAKKFSLQSNSSATTTSTATSNATTSCDTNYKDNKTDSDNYDNLGLDSSKRFYAAQQRQRRNSQSTDSGIYYSSCYCSSSTGSSASLVSSCAASTTSGCSTSAASNKSHKSLHKQKQYLNNHLYIKSYLDILEEDEKARANFKPARPGGIRNYTPKILAETPIAVTKSAAKLRSTTALVSVNSKEDPWI